MKIMYQLVYIILDCTNQRSLYLNSIGILMALGDSWLKFNKGKERDKIEVVTGCDSLSVRISTQGALLHKRL